MLATIEQVLSLLMAVLGVVGVIRARRRALRRFPPRDYEASEQPPARAVQGWRWRTPPEDLDLRVADREDASSLLLPPRVPAVQWVCGLLAYALFAVLAWGLAYRLLVIGWGAEVMLFPLLLLLPWALLHVESRPVQIDLHADEVVVLLRYGIVLHRPLHIRHRPGLRITSAPQSSLSMAAGQELPATVVTIRQPGFWRLDRRIWLDVDPSRASWIAGGLSEWAERPRP